MTLLPQKFALKIRWTGVGRLVCQAMSKSPKNQQSLVSINKLYNLKTISYSLQILRNLLVANFEIMIYRIQNLALPNPSHLSYYVGDVYYQLWLYFVQNMNIGTAYMYVKWICLISDKSLKVWLWNILSIV